MEKNIVGEIIIDEELRFLLPALEGERVALNFIGDFSPEAKRKILTGEIQISKNMKNDWER